MRTAHSPTSQPVTYNYVIFRLAMRFYEAIMTAFLFRCPATGYSVQGLVPDPVPDGETYQSITCTACWRTHLVDPKTGKVAGAGRK
jgi:hypothetical protein